MVHLEAEGFAPKMRGEGKGGGGRWSDRKTVLSVCKGEEWSYSKRVLVVHSLLQARK